MPKNQHLDRKNDARHERPTQIKRYAQETTYIQRKICRRILTDKEKKMTKKLYPHTQSKRFSRSNTDTKKNIPKKRLAYKEKNARETQ